MELQQKQVQRLSQQQLQSVELLQMSALELTNYLQNLAQENPVIDLEDSFSGAEAGPDDELFCRLKWLEDNDRQNYYYQSVDESEWDPVARVGNAGGLEESLVQFLSRQLDRMALDEETVRTVRELASCLNEDGYFLIPLDKLSEEWRVPLSHLQKCLDILRSLEPAGVGAANLSQCLSLQLRRLDVEGPALDIVEGYLEDLAKCRYPSIAAKLHITVDQVLQAKKVIRELEPRPGAIFESPEQVQYILPDVFVEQVDGRFTVGTHTNERPAFQINRYYRDLLAHSEQHDVREYLAQKIGQAERVLWAIDQRERTLLRCAQAIVTRQEAFFQKGPQALGPLRMADVALELGIHESTVSRAIREKYLQCTWGVYPMSYFFSRRVSRGGGEEADLGASAARTLLGQLIAREDKAHPLSDQKLCEKMSDAGCPISRRTVAKYREELNIPNTSGRRQP